MSGLPTPPRLGPRVPLPPPPRERAEGEQDGLVTGDILEGRYQIEERIGEGGVGFVYRALQLKLHRRVAVKLLQRDMVGDEELRPRFEREAITLAALSHPHIVNLQDYGMVRGQPFLVMELLEGRTLREVIDSEGALAPTRALSFTRQLLQALSYAHGRGVVHRDLKPANLLVQELPTHEHLKVLDFGLVKLLPGSFLDSGVQLSRVGFTFGTPAYMSPEHATGGFVDERSDLYSVGILLFEMLTGKKPFDGELHEIIRHHLSTPVPRLADVRPELSGRDDLQNLVDQCLKKVRDERPLNAVSVLSMLEQAEARSLSTSGSLLPGALALDAAGLGSPEAQSVKHEIRVLGHSYKRLAVACVHWLRVQVVPWLKERGERTRASLERVGSLAEQRARAGWAEAGPRLLQAREKLARIAEEARERLRPSQRPPAMSLSERPPEPLPEVVEKPVEAVATALQRAPRSIEQAATLDLASQKTELGGEASAGDADATLERAP